MASRSEVPSPTPTPLFSSTSVSTVIESTRRSSSASKRNLYEYVGRRDEAISGNLRKRKKIRFPVYHPPNGRQQICSPSLLPSVPQSGPKIPAPFCRALCYSPLAITALAHWQLTSHAPVAR